MSVVLAHNIELCSIQAQEVFLREAVGVVRFVDNWVLKEWLTRDEAYKHVLPNPHEAALRRQPNAIKCIPKRVPQYAITNLDKACNRFFRKESGYSTFKKKGRHDSARFDNGLGIVRYAGKRINLPFVGGVKMREALRLIGKTRSATCASVADRWYVSLPVEVEVLKPIRESQAAVGIDLGVTTAATLSTGERLEGPQALPKHLKRLRRLSHHYRCKAIGSNNRRKSARCLARFHARIATIWRDWLHDRQLARALVDIRMDKFKRQLRDQTALSGAMLVEANPWFPSSKMCLGCGTVVKNLPRSVWEWTGDRCGTHHDCDVNAAKILSARYSRGELRRRHACGDRSCGGIAPYRSLRISSVKKESNVSSLGMVRATEGRNDRSRRRLRTSYRIAPAEPFGV
ncbi:RNA-guided endonuclease InsQ/TnpB family protein [Chloroflexus aggregans]|uniref:Transposase IS891/IS1136/IS1341 family n=1 Tax=Chloroflexus aggregans (strain MD-66 / DSM 9485) TaxID=326427 RepID=B8G6T3_CHLAD|nr:RNA-guided endonuclease TnpB family protein [Chloroflexus aggregans]ACL25892.1 putative transposase IS891/IS1136/IS1341 family [Chloroflexus aggregans DSM 9485]